MTDQYVLVLNCGSSSVKFAIINPSSGTQTLSGLAEKIGTTDAQLVCRENDQKTTEALADGEYQTALDTILKRVQQRQEQLVAVGHRVVHGGEQFTESALINDEVMQAIAACVPLAPLHNPSNILGIERAQQALPDLPQVAVFDTAFHQTMPPHAFLYPLPYEYYQQHHARRYGFHGISHRYVAATAVEKLQLNPSRHAIITAHLGNGCSATAIKNGVSIDTTMGLTPLEGLMMGTRSGDIDPGMHAYLCSKLNISIDKLSLILNKQSGLLGISGISLDMRELEQAVARGNERAKLARLMFSYRLAKYIGALAVTLGRLDALIFTGGIGENDRDIRAQTLQQLALLQFELDAEHNQQNGQHNNGVITTANSTTAAVIPTNEELLIAQDSASITRELRAG